LSADVQKVESEKDTLEKQLQEKHEAELETSKRMEELQHESSETSASLATMTKTNKALQLKYDALQDSVATRDKQSEQVAASLKVSEVKVLELQSAKKSLQTQLTAAASKSKKKIPVCPKCPSCSQLVAQSAVAAALPHKRGPPVLRPPDAPPAPDKAAKLPPAPPGAVQGAQINKYVEAGGAADPHPAKPAKDSKDSVEVVDANPEDTAADGHDVEEEEQEEPAGAAAAAAGDVEGAGQDKDFFRRAGTGARCRRGRRRPRCRRRGARAGGSCGGQR